MIEAVRMSDDTKSEPARYLVPVPSLGVPGPWPIGRVVIHPGNDAAPLLANTPPAGDPDGHVARRVQEVLASADKGSVAVVPGGELDAALDELAAALDALRLFQLSRRVTHETTFGLPGDLYSSPIEYVAVWDRAAFGWRFRGDHAGWTFDAESFAAWSASKAFTFLSEALAADAPSEAQRRAIAGTRLLSRAALDHQADLKMIGIASALESWLLERDSGSQTYRLARLASWFSCGVGSEHRCGNPATAAACPYLNLDPVSRRDRQRLAVLRSIGIPGSFWRCAEWHRIVDWYGARSGAAHGEWAAVDLKDAESAEYWVSHYLAPPILEWLADHREQPVADLEAAIRAAADPTAVESMRAALDEDPPPVRPPLDP
ncbi:MAG TPA: hypothetical protein VMN58_13700 [Acidimicrobiales bacterium]|nr:hypothetical protein [Acidimicrobiales bacterium]